MKLYFMKIKSPTGGV